VHDAPQSSINTPDPIDSISRELFLETSMNSSASTSNKTFVLMAFDTLFNKRDYKAAEAFGSPNYIPHSAHVPLGRSGLF
jgi:hypothetical protein